MARNNLNNFPVALRYRLTRGIRSGYLGEPPPLRITQNRSQLHQAYLKDEYIGGLVSRLVPIMVKPSNKHDDELPLIAWLCPTRLGSSQARSVTCSSYPQCFIT